jgi:UDP-GlcNAc:undecaprenyl-phosphate GlcNAc-1-phosphate transferase
VPLLLLGLLFDAAFNLLRRALMRERATDGHCTHLYQLAARSGMRVPAVAAVHWGFVAFHAALCVLVLRPLPGEKPLVVLPALAVQIAWLAYVAWWVRRAGIGRRMQARRRTRVATP